MQTTGSQIMKYPESNCW